MKGPRVDVLVASENRLFRECLADRIARDRRFRMQDAISIVQLPMRLKKERPGLLLVDADSLGPVPESLLARLRSDWPELRVLAMARQVSDPWVARALRFGAAGLVGKNESVTTLLQAMEAVASGETWAGRRAIAQALSGLVKERRRSASPLTSRERQLLSLLGEGYRNKELATLLKIKEHTVKIHLHSLFRKLNVRTRVEAALKAATQG